MARDDVDIDPQTASKPTGHTPKEDAAGQALPRTVPNDSDMPSFPAPSVAGDLGRLGKYRIQKELGRGGMGAVYLAFDERLERQVALKVLLPKSAADDTARERFLREARAAAQISSDHVVHIYEAEEIDGITYIASQFLQGSSLDEYLNTKGNPTIPQIIRIGAETALGLAKAHDLGIVHRDIKPSNLWLESPNRRIKILDFGLAKPGLVANAVELTGTGAILGTPAYMAPEQGMGKDVDGRADLFSLGCVLYRLCTGELPFQGPTVMAVLTALASEEPTPVRKLNPAVPESLVDLIRRLMAKSPDHRPPTATAVVEALGQISGLAKNASTPEVSNSQPNLTRTPVVIGINNRRQLIDNNDRTEIELMPSQTAGPPKKSWKFPVMLVGSLLFGLVPLGVAGVIIHLATKGGSVTERPGPVDPKVEVSVTTITPDPKKRDSARGPAVPLPATYRNSIGMELVKVPKGTAWLGGGGGKPGETKVVIAADFYLGKYEVTQEEWEAVTGQNPSTFKGGHDMLKDVPDADLKRFPVEMVSWLDCQLFIQRLNEKEKEPGWVYRLPKEVEWEYACRGGPVDKRESAFDFYFLKTTNILLPNQANFNARDDKPLKRTCKAGSYEANSLGLHDMHGNVWEWCDDTEKAPDGALRRVIRGGGWDNDGPGCRAPRRVADTPSNKLSHLGLRLARVPTSPPSK